MNKIIILLVFIFAITCKASAQQENDLFLGGYGSVAISCRLIAKDVGVFTTGVGGIIIKNHRLGVFYSGLTNRFSEKKSDKKSFKFSCYSGGVSYGYPFSLLADWSLVPNIRLGYGSTHMINTNWENIKVANFLGVTPSFALENALTDFLVISFGIEYNFSHFNNVKVNYMVENEFNRLGAFISIKIGQFE